MSKQTNKIIDSFSASELLKALSTLQKLSQHKNEFQISFCRQSVANHDNPHTPSRAIHYEQYNHNKNKSKLDPLTPSCQRKSITPLKEQRDNTCKRTSNIKSRSHSPLDQRSQKNNSRITNYSKNHVSRIQTQKQNKRKAEEKLADGHPASFQSKKILDQKQKTGMNYIPIQYRAEELLKEKQMKLAKLQRQKQISKLLEQKQCTFKPTIIKNYKRPKCNMKDQNFQKISEQQFNRFDECFIDKQFLCTPTQPFTTQYQADYQQLQQQQLFSNRGINAHKIIENNETKVVKKKYKNQKFNCLLDLIH